MKWCCTCNIVALDYFIESVEVAKASRENKNNCEHWFLCHVCDVQSGCGVTKWCECALLLLLKINCLVVDVMQ
jgi:hypothetical protein